MTKQETAMILKVIKSEWPHRFEKMNTVEMTDMLNLWEEMFRDDDAGLVGAAVKSLIVAGNREFAPNIGVIKEQMRKLTAKDDMIEAEAWATIRKAIKNGLYGSKEEFERLPPLCKKLVGSPSQLREWAMIDSDELHTVVASNVQRAYRTMYQRETEAAKLPSDVRAFISEYSALFSMDSRSKADLPPRIAEKLGSDKSMPENFGAVDALKTLNCDG